MFIEPWVIIVFTFFILGISNQQVHDSRTIKELEERMGYAEESIINLEPDTYEEV